MGRFIGLLSAVLTACIHTAEPASAVAVASEESSDLLEARDRMWQWFRGEFSNHEQVAEQTYAGTEPYRSVHHLFAPVSAPQIGSHVLFVQQSLTGQEDPYRLRLYSLEIDAQRDAVRLDIFRFTDESAWTNAHLTPNVFNNVSPHGTVQKIDGCSVFFTESSNQFIGSTDPDACRVFSERRQETLHIHDDIVLTEEHISIHDVARDAAGDVVFGHPDGDPHLNRRVQYYSGWAVVRRGGPEYDREEPEWQVHRGLHLHSEGGLVDLKDASGEDIPYRVELARLTRSASNTHLLKLSLVDRETGKTVAYTWSDPKSDRIGVNLGWAQIGVTKQTITPEFGFDSEETSSLVQQLATYLDGSMSSTDQATQDADFRDVHLQTCRVNAPGLGTTVLYVEQAIAGHLETPYRQRLYVLKEKSPTEVESVIYALAEPEPFIGTCTRRALREVHASEAVLREGCAVTLSRGPEGFRGRTDATTCSSALRGAQYATVEIEVSKSELRSWDRGWDSTNAQVWGSEKGPYRFLRAEGSASH